MNWKMRFVNDKEGATMAEYAVIAFVLILVAIAVFTNLGQQIVRMVGSLVNADW